MPSRLIQLLLAGASVLAAAGACGGLQLSLKSASVQKPSNVALYFSVEDGKGNPVGGLTAETFKIYEDEQLISVYESKQTILNPEESVVHYTLLLVDLSGSITESGSLPALTEAASGFAERVTKFHQIGVWGFDGGAKLIPIAGFSTSGRAVGGSIQRLGNRKGKDPSTNLRGAVAEALGVLRAQMDRSKQALRFGTLVVFTDGTDRAHRVKEEELDEAMEQAKDLHMFSIGLGAEISEKDLSRIGRSGFVKATDQSSIQKAFDEVATRIENAARKYYLLSYCSPARAGKHRLIVEAHGAGSSGKLEFEFDAEGFAHNCDPKRRPNFPIGKVTR